MERIKRLIKESGAEAFVITQTKEKQTEVFLIRDQIDLTRGVSVVETTVQIYRDFEEEGRKYRGSALMHIGAMDSDEEIRRKAEKAYMAARYVKNPWYPLSDNKERPKDIAPEPLRKTFQERFGEVLEALYPPFEGASVNSCELFAKEGVKRLVSSTGTDISWPLFRLDFELVTEAEGQDEGVEIFNEYALGTLDIEKIRDIARRQLENTRHRAEAKKAPAMEKARIVLSGNDVETLFGFFIHQATDKLVYQQISRGKKGESFIRKPLDITIEPLAFSADRAPVDREGSVCEAFCMYKEGVLEKFLCGCQYGSYLGEKVTGYQNTFTVSPGETSREELLGDKYLELLTFSDFQMDAATGDFGGEFRLARYVHDGVTEYLTGGAISGNLFELKEDMMWSREMLERPRSLTPEIVVFPGMKVTGEA